MLTGIIEAYKMLGVFVGGVGTVLILRWYWWRVTAWSEIAAIIGALTLGISCEVLLANPVNDEGEVVADYFAYRVIITTFGTMIVWVAVSFLTYRKPSAGTIKFCREVRPSGPGWALVRNQEGIPKEPGEFGRSTAGWLASIAFIYAMLLGIGSAIFSRWAGVAVCVVIAAMSAVVLRWVLKRSIFGDSPGGPADTGTGVQGG